MKYLALQAVLIHGARVERGQEIDIPQELAISIGMDYLSPVVETPQEEEVIAKNEYDAMTRQELIDECKERGLPIYGNKAEIVERLSLSSQ